MGIRIHKAIGYGLTDLKTTREDKDHSPDLADPRINPKGYLGADSDPEAPKFSFERYLQFVEKFKWKTLGRPRMEQPLMERMLLQERNEKKRAELNFPYDSITWDNEAGQANVLLVIPPCMVTDWRRHDSTIDYCEETESPSGIEGRTVLLRTAPFPWSVGREDLRTGKMIGDDWRWAKKKYSAEPGTDWRWIVPAEVACICKFLKLFTDDEVIRSLRPILHVWWG